MSLVFDMAGIMLADDFAEVANRGVQGRQGYRVFPAQSDALGMCGGRASSHGMGGTTGGAVRLH